LLVRRFGGLAGQAPREEARVLFRRPWTVEAVPTTKGTMTTGPTTKGKRTRKRHVIGWRAALRTRDALAEHLRTGAPMDSVIQPG